MSYAQNNRSEPSYSGFDRSVAEAGESERTAFIRRTYAHLAGAIAAFVAIETLIFTMVPEATLQSVFGTLFANRFSWLVVLGAFMGVSWLANHWASSSTSLATQYLGLGLYVLAEAVVFLPILYAASRFAPGAIGAAGIITLAVFGGLTIVVFVTRADFSWLGRYLCLAGFVALGFMICGMLFNFGLGTWFAAIMVGVASGYILYDTSNVLHRYRASQHVAAALALFASVALLFWYVLRIVMSFSNRN